MGQFISRETVARAREMDLYSYLDLHEPDNLIRAGTHAWRLKEHDSLVISNGRWIWNSRSIGGRSALDFLIKVRGMSLQDAVEAVLGSADDRTQAEARPPVRTQAPVEFALPPRHTDDRRVYAYLIKRGISPDVIRFCIRAKVLYESAIHHNAVFVGLDYTSSTPRYAALRGVCSDFRMEQPGSRKEFTFRLDAEKSDTVHLFEAPIDALSYASLLQMRGTDFRRFCLLSLGGVSRDRHAALPHALCGYLQNNPQTRTVCLHLDNDEAGRIATAAICDALPELVCLDQPAPEGKDINDYLCICRARAAQRDAGHFELE